MIASVKAYYNTGLQINNSLDSIGLLDSLGFSSRTFDSIAIKQDRGRINIRINTTYDNIKDADYVKINDVGYWVTGITMLNDNVAEVGLQQDYVTTVGTGSIEVVSGWCVRKHVTTDTIYENTLDEPFAPSSPLKVEFGKELKGANVGTTGYIYVVLSSIDLINLSNEADDYIDQANDKVLVPKLSIVPDTGTNTTYTSHITGQAESCKLPATQAYAGGDNQIMSALSKVRSLGVESCIVACYMIPLCWATQHLSSGKITSLEDETADITSDFVVFPSSSPYKNNKVYSGQFQRLCCYSLASGESYESRVEDIQMNGVVQWHTAADPRYNGNPICMPTYYHNAANSKLIGCINGAKWQNIPITYQGASGAGFLQNNLQIQNDKIESQRLYGLLGGISGMLMGGQNPANFQGSGDWTYNNSSYGGLGSFVRDNSSMGFGGDANPLSMSGKILGGVAAMGAVNANLMYQKQSMFNGYNQAMATLDVQFPRVPSFQDYIGNVFYEMRYMLSDNDMVRFDNFLTQFGYAVDEVLNSSCFGGRTHFNYVQGKDVALKKSGVPQYLLNGMARMIESGVRIWHTAPSSAKLLDNPIA